MSADRALPLAAVALLAAAGTSVWWLSSRRTPADAPQAEFAQHAEASIDTAAAEGALLARLSAPDPLLERRPEPVLPGERELRGRVLLATGQPASGAEVRVTEEDGTREDEHSVGSAEPRQPRADKVLKTKADGTFVATGLGEGPFVVRASSAVGWVGEGRTWDSPATTVPCGTEVELVLEPPRVLIIEVVDDRGEALLAFGFGATAPQSAATGRANPWEKWAWPQRRRGNRIELLDPSPGLWHLSVTAPGHGPVDLEVPVPAVERVVAVVPRHARVSGTVVDPRGAVVPGAVVWARLPGDEKLWEQGVFRLDAEGGFTGTVPPQVVLQANAVRRYPSADLWLDLAPGEERTGLRLVLGERR